MTNGEAWGYAVARCGDVVALLVVAIATLTVAFIADDPAVSCTCWAAAVTLLVLSKRSLRSLESEL